MITWTDGCFNLRKLIDLGPMITHKIDHSQTWSLWTPNRFGASSVRDSWETYESWAGKQQMYDRHRNRHGFHMVDGATPVENLRVRTLRW